MNLFQMKIINFCAWINNVIMVKLYSIYNLQVKDDIKDFMWPTSYTLGQWYNVFKHFFNLKKKKKKTFSVNSI